MPAGRPPVFETSYQMEKLVEEYFDSLYPSFDSGRVDKSKDPRPSTITGLCIHLGFESRQSFYDYEKKPEFTYIVKMARLRIEFGYENRLMTMKNPAGAIFALKNMGWADKLEVEKTVKRLNFRDAQ